MTKRTALLLAALLAACSSTKEDARPAHQPTGFLSDYPELAPSPRSPDVDVWIAESTDFTGYDKVLIDPVRVFVPDASRTAGLDDAELQQLGVAFRDEIVRQLEIGYAVVDTPAPGTLRFRYALTGVLPAADEKRAERSASERFHLGGASMELEVVDAVSGERLCVAISTKQAEAVASGVLPYTTQTQAASAFRDWAAVTRKGLDLRTQRK